MNLYCVDLLTTYRMRPYMLRNLKVTKSNYLVQASYKFTIPEMRIILLAVSKAQKLKIQCSEIIVVSAEDYAELIK